MANPPVQHGLHHAHAHGFNVRSHSSMRRAQATIAMPSTATLQLPPAWQTDPVDPRQPFRLRVRLDTRCPNLSGMPRHPAPRHERAPCRVGAHHAYTAASKKAGSVLVSPTPSPFPGEALFRAWREYPRRRPGDMPGARVGVSTRHRLGSHAGSTRRSTCHALESS